MLLGVELMSLEPSSNMRRLVMKPGRLPGPDGEVRWRMVPTPGDGALLGGVARPRPESVSPKRYVKLSWSVLDPAEKRTTQRSDSRRRHSFRSKHCGSNHLLLSRWERREYIEMIHSYSTNASHDQIRLHSNFTWNSLSYARFRIYF